MKKFELLGSEIYYKGRAFTIRRDHLRTPDGHETDFDIVEHHGSVVILPIDESGNLVLVRQYRHAAEQDLLELPAGTLEPGEDPLHCARREIREETGFAAEQFQKVGKFYLAPGYSTELMFVYIATDLHPAPLPPDEDEFLKVETFSVSKVFDLAAEGKIPDAKSLAAFFLALPFLEEYRQQKS
jgi:ADP-ribose pyrophosphatase